MERTAPPNTATETSFMKKPLKKSSRNQFNLGELILAVSNSSRNNRETIAAVADLLDTGKVRFASHGQKLRARVC
jgi:ABC-type molybdate transport system substrate-binding protein